MQFRLCFACGGSSGADESNRTGDISVAGDATAFHYKFQGKFERGVCAIADNAKPDAAKASAPGSPRAKAKTKVPANHGGSGMADAREVMNIRQASQYLGVSPDTLYKYVSEESIPAFKLGNRWKFKKSILDSWMENKSFTSEVARPRKLARPVKVMAAAD